MNVHPMYHKTPPPDALDDAVKCSCGGEAIWHRAKDGGDTEHLHCSNTRCGRIVAGEYREIEKCVERWNQEIAEESCECHSWMISHDGTKARCIFCEKIETFEKGFKS